MRHSSHPTVTLSLVTLTDPLEEAPPLDGPLDLILEQIEGISGKTGKTQISPGVE